MTRVRGLRYCHFVHSHHNAESIMLFPELRPSNPSLNSVVDRLEADHESVSALLDEVDAAARALGTREDRAPRERLRQALHNLSTELLGHLQYEEEHIFDTLRTWTAWPR